MLCIGVRSLLLFLVGCGWLCVGCCLVSFVQCALHVVSFFGVSYVMIVVRSVLLFVVGCVLLVVIVCCVLVVMYCLLLVMCCWSCDVS